MKSKIIVIAFLSIVATLFIITGVINYIKHTPERLTAQYKKQVFKEVRQFVLEFPLNNLSVVEVMFLNPRTYNDKMEKAIIEQFGEEKYSIFKSQYDSMHLVNPVRTDSAFSGIYNLHVARDSLWRNFKKKYF